MGDYYSAGDKVERLTTMLCELHEKLEANSYLLKIEKDSNKRLAKENMNLCMENNRLRGENIDLGNELKKAYRVTDGYKPNEQMGGC